MSHALLSASSAKRWLTCTPSARLCENMPDTASEYAAEGTLAHAIAELKLRKYIEPMSTRTYNRQMKKLEEDPAYQAEMQSYTDVYMDYIKDSAALRDHPPHIVAEYRVDYSAYAPEGYGTADCIMIGDGLLEIVDYKHGKGVPVSAENNPQLRLYALGAMRQYMLLYPVHKIRMTIIQPRIDNTNSADMNVSELLEWGASIKPLAQAAYEGTGDFVAGEHCRFCAAKAICRARSREYTALEDFRGEDPALLTPEEIGVILGKIDGLKNWASDVSAYALQKILSGEEIPGWKAVEGRSNREIRDLDTAFNLLKLAGYPDEVLYERKPLTITGLEKLVGKARLSEIIGNYIVKPEGKPTLAPESDTRTAITRAKSDFKEEVS
jgi:phage protein